LVCFKAMRWFWLVFYREKDGVNDRFL
jgi:hypothetical protein